MDACSHAGAAHRPRCREASLRRRASGARAGDGRTDAHLVARPDAGRRADHLGAQPAQRGAASPRSGPLHAGRAADRVADADEERCRTRCAARSVPQHGRPRAVGPARGSGGSAPGGAGCRGSRLEVADRRRCRRPAARGPGRWRERTSMRRSSPPGRAACSVGAASRSGVRRLPRSSPRARRRSATSVHVEAGHDGSRRRSSRPQRRAASTARSVPTSRGGACRRSASAGMDSSVAVRCVRSTRRTSACRRRRGHPGQRAAAPRFVGRRSRRSRRAASVAASAPAYGLGRRAARDRARRGARRRRLDEARARCCRRASGRRTSAAPRPVARGRRGGRRARARRGGSPARPSTTAGRAGRRSSRSSCARSRCSRGGVLRLVGHGVTCRFARREDRRRALPGRLRRAADRPPADGHPGADDQGRRVGARALRRRLLQAAQLDVARRAPSARAPPRTATSSGRSPRQDRRHPADPDRGDPPRLLARPRRRPRACRRTASRSTSRSCSPSTPPPSPTA